MAMDEELFYDTEIQRIQQELRCTPAQASCIYGQAFVSVFGGNTSEALPLEQVKEAITGLVEFVKEFKGLV